eukprot:5981332-Amphidinium_carterae.1
MALKSAGFLSSCILGPTSVMTLLLLLSLSEPSLSVWQLSVNYTCFGDTPEFWLGGSFRFLMRSYAPNYAIPWKVSRCWFLTS